MKKIISIVLAVLLLVFMVLPAAASETARASGDCGEGMTWTEDGEPHKEPKAVKIVDGAYQMQ